MYGGQFEKLKLIQRLVLRPEVRPLASKRRSPLNSASKNTCMCQFISFYVNPWDSLDRHDFQLSFELTEKRYVHTCKYVPILPKIRLHRLDVVNGLSSEKMNLLSTPFNRHLAGTWC